MTTFTDLTADPHSVLFNMPTAIHGQQNYGLANYYATKTPAGEDNTHAETCMMRNFGTEGPQQAWNVPTIGPTEQANRNAMRSVHIPNTGVPFIFTGGLTGCCVAIALISPQEMLMSHVQPNGEWENGADRGDSATMETTMRAGITLQRATDNVGFAATHFCGVSNYRQMGLRGTVIGIAVAGAWQVWMQSTSGGMTSTRQVVHLSRLL